MSSTAYAQALCLGISIAPRGAIRGKLPEPRKTTS